jgi:bla regulator protein blaR1
MVAISDAHRAAAFVMVLVAAVCAGFVRPAVQGPAQPAFEVASIKANRSGEPYVGAPGDRFSNGRFRYTNVPLRLLIRQAFERYRTDDARGGPGWLDTDRWDIDAQAVSATADMLPMIRTLLTDRFRLRHHIESEEGAVYELTFARGDRRFGSSLRPGTGSRSFLGGGSEITGRAISIPDLTRLLSSYAGRPVLDRTGLMGTYDIDLRWAPATPAGQAPADLPDFFTAIQEQLWLRLQPARGPVDRLVIDSAERPTDN